MKIRIMIMIKMSEMIEMMVATLVKLIIITNNYER